MNTVLASNKRRCGIVDLGRASYQSVHRLQEALVAARYAGQIDDVLLLVALSGVDIQGYRRDGMTGVWVANRKIAAIGVAVRNWVTFHGFALNVACDLEPFEWIVPCGLAGVEMTTVQQIRPQAADITQMGGLVAEAFCRVFEVEGYPLDGEELSQVVASIA